MELQIFGFIPGKQYEVVEGVCSASTKSLPNDLRPAS
jgi:hypothetical protein